jgi:hypothetical protein
MLRRNDEAVEYLSIARELTERGNRSGPGSSPPFDRTSPPATAHPPRCPSLLDQGRLFWTSDFRDEVLAQLLALNAERYAEEVQLGIVPQGEGKGARG